MVPTNSSLSSGLGHGLPRHSSRLLSVLMLSDGTFYEGLGFGSEGTFIGELVFNTSMTGYQEALTDPSYAGQILTMTYPLIGNYGINGDDFESTKVHVAGFVVKKACAKPYHYKSDRNLSEFLADHGVGGIEGIDTRAIVRKIRSIGVVPSAIYVGSKKPDLEELRAKAKSLQYSKTDYVGQVSPAKVKFFGEGKKRVVLIDCGAKGNIERELVSRGFEVAAVPAYSSAADIAKLNPDGLMVSNGPGDPELLGSIADTIKEFFHIPVFGICLGHQILAKAAGAKTYKLKFGHRGANHPVLDLKLNKVFITTQNHGFAVDLAGLSKDFEQTHVNCNDNTCEGLSHRSKPIFSVQYHPEACPGPQDSKYLFDKFAKAVNGSK